MPRALHEELAPMGKKKVAVVIGRFSPATAGHYALIDETKRFIRTHKDLHLDAKPVIIVIGGNGQDKDKERNPLDVADRIRFMKASGKCDGCVFLAAPQVFAGLAKLRDEGYEPIAVASGTDRAGSYENILDSYFKTPDDQPIKHYTISLDRRDYDVGDSKKKMDKLLDQARDGADFDVGQVSASLARRAAELGYEEEFTKIVGLEDKPSLAKRLMSKVAAAMKGEAPEEKAAA